MRSQDRVAFWGFGGGATRFQVALLPFWFLMGVLGIVVGGLSNHHAAPFVAGLVVCLFILALSLLIARPALVISDGLVRVPRLFDARVVPLSEISGIGLTYRVESYTPGWRLEIWDADGNSIELKAFLVTPRWSSRPVLAPGARRDAGTQPARAKVAEGVVVA